MDHDSCTILGSEALVHLYPMLFTRRAIDDDHSRDAPHGHMEYHVIGSIQKRDLGHVIFSTGSCEINGR
jgi:hypothetical protein